MTKSLLKACGQTIFASEGFEIVREENGDILVKITNGEKRMVFLNDDEYLADGRNHTVSVVFDGGVPAVYFVTDGRFCDGGEKRQYGFTRLEKGSKIVFSAQNAAVNELKKLRVCSGIHLYD